MIFGTWRIREDYLQATPQLCGSLAICGLALATLAVSTPLIGMTLSEMGDQLILTGPVVAGDAGKVRRALAGNPAIRTVILRNSLGGDVPTGYEIGDLMREKGLRTAVSGYCYSSCSRMFLGGKERVFTDDYPLLMTQRLSGHSTRKGRCGVCSTFSW